MFDSLWITGDLWLRFKAYLSSRYQMGRVNRKYSYTLPVISGVPQESILGPLLFLIYVNDIPLSILHSSVLLFADDKTYYKHVKCPSDATLLQHDLDALSTWSNGWKLFF